MALANFQPLDVLFEPQRNASPLIEQSSQLLRHGMFFDDDLSIHRLIIFGRP